MVKAGRTVGRIRLSTLIKAWAVLYALLLVAIVAPNAKGLVAYAKVIADPVTTQGSVTGVQGYTVNYAYVDQSGRTHTGYYFGSSDSDPAAAEVHIGQLVEVQYARTDPANSYGGDARYDLTHDGLAYLGFFALIVASLVTTVAFGVNRWADVLTPASTKSAVEPRKTA